MGGSAALGLGAGISGGVGLQLVADPSGKVGVAASLSENPGTLGVLGVGAMGGFQATLMTNATTLDKFASPFGTQASLSVGVAGKGGGVSLSGSSSPSSTTLTGTIGPGGGPFNGLGAWGAATELGGTWIPFSTQCGGG